MGHVGQRLGLINVLAVPSEDQGEFHLVLNVCDPFRYDDVITVSDETAGGFQENGRDLGQFRPEFRHM